MQLVMSQPLKPTAPEEIPSRTAEAGSSGGGEGQDLGQIPGLGQGKSFHRQGGLAEGGQAAGGPHLEGPLHAGGDTVPRGRDSGGEHWGVGNPKDLGLVHRLKPGQGPVPAASPGTEAKDDRPPVAVEDGTRGGFKGPAQLIRDENVLLILAQLINIIHVAESGLPEATHEEATEKPLQAGQKGLNVDGEEDGGGRIPLTNGELHLLVRRQAVQHEAGSSTAVEGSTHCLRTRPKPMASRTRSSHCRDTRSKA